MYVSMPGVWTERTLKYTSALVSAPALSLTQRFSLASRHPYCLKGTDGWEISHTSFSRPSGPLTIAPQRPCSWNTPDKYRAASKCQTLCQGLCTLKQPPGSPIALRGEEAAVLKIRSTSTRLASCKSGSVSRALGQVPGPDWGTWLFSTNCDEVRQHGHKATKAQSK